MSTQLINIPVELADIQADIESSATALSGSIDLLETSDEFAIYGGGLHGDVTISGPLTLSGDVYYNNLTIMPGAAMNTNHYKIFVKDTLDLTNATSANSIFVTAETASNTVGGGVTGDAGGDALFGGGGEGVAINAVGTGGRGGNGGRGNSFIGTYYNGGVNPVVKNVTPNILNPHIIIGTALVAGGGGGGGGGDGVTSDKIASSPGGGGGVGGGIIFISAKKINRSGSTATSLIKAVGGFGGNGGGVSNACGGGQGGGGGGWIFFIYSTLLGSTATDILDVSGGVGGSGGTDTAATYGGYGGQGGGGGRITFFNVLTGVVSNLLGSNGSSGSANSGATGGAGGAGNTFRASL